MKKKLIYPEGVFEAKRGWNPITEKMPNLNNMCTWQKIMLYTAIHKKKNPIESLAPCAHTELKLIFLSWLILI